MATNELRQVRHFPEQSHETSQNKVNPCSTQISQPLTHLLSLICQQTHIPNVCSVCSNLAIMSLVGIKPMSTYE